MEKKIQGWTLEEGWLFSNLESLELAIKSIQDRILKKCLETLKVGL